MSKLIVRVHIPKTTVKENQTVQMLDVPPDFLISWTKYFGFTLGFQDVFLHFGKLDHVKYDRICTAESRTNRAVLYGTYHVIHI